MIALYAPGGEYVREVREALASEGEVFEFQDWNGYEVVGCRSSCLVVVSADLTDGSVLSNLAQLRGDSRRCPIVVVSEEPRRSLAFLREFGVVEIVEPAAVTEQLEQAICRARVYGLLDRIAREVQLAQHLPELLKGALAEAVRRAPPPVTVDELAATTDCSSESLRSYWRRVVPDSSFNLEDFVETVVLLRAFSGHYPGRSWDAVAGDIGLDLEALDRISERCCGYSLSRVDYRREKDVVNGFEQRIRRELLWW